MNELEIDKYYFDNDFINIINNADTEKLETFIKYVLENYSCENDYNKISSIQNIKKQEKILFLSNLIKPCFSEQFKE